MIHYLISIASACNLQIERIEIFPTVNEQFIMPLQELFNDYNLNYSCGLECPESVKIFNVMNLDSSYVLNYTAQMLSSNNTHFATVGDDKNVYLYQYNEANNQMNLQISGQLPKGQKCLGLLLTYADKLILDCYDQQQQILYFNYLNKGTLKPLQTFQNQIKPQLTKLLNFKQGQESFLLYAQFYQFINYNYQILTLYRFEQDEYINLTTWSYGFQDFDVSDRYIYIVSANNQKIYQVNINQTYSFVILFEYKNSSMYLAQIKASSFYFYQSQCDFLAVATHSYQPFAVVFFQAWNNSIIYTDFFENEKFIQHDNFMISDQFFLIQRADTIQVTEIGIPFLRNNFNMNISLSNFLYLNPRNSKLFMFSDNIQIYTLKIPQIQIYTHEINQQKLRIIGNQTYQRNKNSTLCNLEVLITVLEANDTNVYVNFNESNIFFNSMLTNPFQYKLNNVAGPLLRATGLLQNPSIGAFQEVTFEKSSFYFNKAFSVTKIYKIPNTHQNQNLEKLKQKKYSFFFAGSTSEGIYFYICTDKFICDQIYKDLNISSITQIQIQYNFQGIFIIGVDQGQANIVIYSVNISSLINKEEFVQKKMLQFPNYKQYFLMYDQIVLLLLNNEIYIQSLRSSDTFSMNGQLLNNLFSKQVEKYFEFTPINIEMNWADQSSILFINNNNSFIIIGIQNTNLIIPFSIVLVNQSIYQLNIINYQLILSFKCDQHICFDIWNVQYLLNPQFVKTLPRLLMQEKLSIQSDNLFLYILSQNLTVFVYNPLLSYHSTLYYEFQITDNSFCSLSMGTYSIISSKNSLYNLKVLMIQQFNSNINDPQPKYIIQSYFNFSVTNKFQSHNQTQNKLLTLINPYTKIDLTQIELNVSFVQHENILINLSQNISQQTQAQIQNYSFINLENDDCNLSNYIELADIKENNLNISSKSIINLFNQTLILQNGLEFSSPNITISDNIMLFQEFLNENLSNPFNLSNQYEPYCNTTSFYNQSIVTQMCQICTNNTQKWFMIQFEFICFNFEDCKIINQFIYNISSVSEEFEKIIKQVSINQQNQLVLGTQNGQVPCLYKIQTLTNGLYFIEQLYLICDTGIVDFDFFAIYPNGLIFVICDNKLLYTRVFMLNQFSYDYTLSFLFDTEKYLQTGQSQLNSISLLRSNKYTFLLLLTTNNAVSVIVSASFIVHLSKEILITSFNVVKTIPPYGTSLKQIWEQNGLILIEYQIQQNQRRQVYAIYDWTIMNDSLIKPLLMSGGFEYNGLLNSIALNLTSSQKGGYIYQIIDGKLNAYIVSQNAYLNCTFHDKKDSQLIMNASNYLSNSQFIINFQYTTHKQWFIGLLVFFTVVLIISIFLHWYKTKDIIDKESLLEEIELNE